MNPIELLEDRLKEYERSLQKSFTAFIEQKITEEEHNIHKRNLNPLILKYIIAIELLKNHDRKILT